MTQAQVNWAKRHDWFVADLGNGRIIVLDDYVDCEGKVHRNTIAWTGTFQELRNWAGY